MRSHRRLMRRPLPAVFPSVGSCRLCTNYYLFFNFYCFRSRRLSPEHRRCLGLRAFFISPPLSPIMGDALFQTPYAQAAPCRLPERRLLPTLHKYFLFFIFTFSLAKVLSRAPAVLGPPRIFYFSPSVPHYGGCALTDALCAGPSLPSSRASAPADFGFPL